MARDPITGARISAPTYYKVGSDFFTGVNQKVSDQNTLASLQSGKTPFSNVQSGLEGQFTDPQFFDKIKKGEPAILSSSAGRSAFDKNIAPKIQQANQNAQKIQQNSQSKTEKDTSTDVASMLASEGETTEDAVNRKILENYDKQRESAEAIFDSLTALQNNNAQMQRNSLSNSYNQRRNELEKANNRYMRDVQTSMIRSGVSRYAPQSANNFLSAKEQEHIQTLTDLDNEYNAKLGEINSAMEAKSISLAAQLTQDLNQIDEKVLKVVQEQAKEAAKVTKKIRDRNIQASRDSVIADLLSQGVEDPNDILNILNFDDDGKMIGDFTADEIGKALKILNPKTDLARLSADYRTYDYLRKNNDPSVDGLSYLDFLQATANAKRKATTEKPESSLANQIMDGFTDPSDLTSAQRQKARDELYDRGFNSDTPPQWYVDYIQEERQQTMKPDAIKKMWIEYKNEIMGKFDDEDESSLYEEDVTDESDDEDLY